MNVTRGALKVEGDGVKTCVSTKNERRMVLRPSAKHTLQFEPRFQTRPIPVLSSTSKCT